MMDSMDWQSLAVALIFLFAIIILGSIGMI